MSIKNGDMPASPFQEVTGMISGCPTGYKNHKGLTKREEFAMNISGHMLQSLNVGASNGEWEYPSFEELVRQSVLYADALLTELERTK